MYCSNCGKEFYTEDKRIRLCPECKELKNNNTTKTCVICGVELTGNLRKYCTVCAKAIRRNQIKKAMSNKHCVALDKDIYNNFLIYFPKPIKEIEHLMLLKIEGVCKH